MPSLLCIDTATDVCSVAVSRDGQVLFNREDHAGPNHAERLGPFVDEALAYADGHGMSLDAVAVSSGPGSYTGLRIGVSMAKGLCYGRELRLIAVPTLEVLCAGVIAAGISDDGLLCPMIDARRMEVYAAVYDHDINMVRPVQADIVDADTYKAFLNNKVYFFGNGAAKCMDTIGHPKAVLVDGIEPLARNMTALAEQRLAAGQTEDVAYYEPFYLKEYIAKMKNSANE